MFSKHFTAYVCRLFCYLVEDYSESGSPSSSEVDSDVQGEDEEGLDNSENDNLSDGYLSDSGSDVSSGVIEDGDTTEKTSDVVQPYLPPQLQSQTNNVKLRKSINGLINRY